MARGKLTIGLVSAALCAAPAALAATAGVGAEAGAGNIAPCKKAMVGHGSADWRSESTVAGPVGARRHPLSSMARQANGLTTKMPLLVEGREPERVVISVPPGLRSRVFLYYGEVLDREGNPSFTFAGSPGYSSTTFELCGDKPRTIWPGGVRVRGTAPVHLTVRTEDGRAFQLRLGRPRVYRPG